MYLNDGRWWWQDPLAPAAVYVIIDNKYYRYQDNAGTVVVRPDTTSPVEAPPAEPSAAAPESDEDTMYSLDGTRSVQILTDKKEAYLYDLTGADPNGAAAGGRWLASGMKSAKFVYDDKLAAVVDPEGERKIMISGSDRSADLYNLKDGAIEPVYLASGASEIKLVNGETTNAAGETVRALKLAIITAKDAAGAESLLMFDRDGALFGIAAPKRDDAASGPSPAERMNESEAFNALKAESIRW